MVIQKPEFSQVRQEKKGDEGGRGKRKEVLMGNAVMGYARRANPSYEKLIFYQES